MVLFCLFSPMDKETLNHFVAVFFANELFAFIPESYLVFIQSKIFEFRKRESFLLFFFHLRLSFFIRGVQGGIFLFSFSFSLF